MTLTMAALAKTAAAAAKGEEQREEIKTETDLLQLILKMNVKCELGSENAPQTFSSFSAFATPRWATFVKYGKVELMPPSPAELPAAFAQLGQLVKSGMTFQWRNVTVRVSKKAEKNK